MNRFVQHLIAFLAILLFAGGTPILAGTTDSVAVSRQDNIGWGKYYGTVTFTDSASGAIYITQAFSTAPMHQNYGYAVFQCSEAGTEDVNISWEYSFDLENWVAGTTDGDLDAVGTTAVIDTLGIADGVVESKYRLYPYARLKFTAGQNINSTTVTWTLEILKPSGLELVDLFKVYDTEA